MSRPKKSVLKLFRKKSLWGSLTFYVDYEKGYLAPQYSKGSPAATFTRTTGDTATYIDSAGVVRLATDSQPRYQGGYYDETGFHAQKGYMAEASRTNVQCYTDFADTNFSLSTGVLLKYSGTGVWYKNEGDGAGTATLDIDSIYGKSVKLVVTTPGIGAHSIAFASYNNDYTQTNGQLYTISFYVKTDIAKTIPLKAFDSSDGTTARYSTTFNTVANTWIKISKTYTADITDDVKLNFDLGNLGLFTFWITGINVENAPYATSPIPTTTASLTRNADVLTYLIAGNRTAEQETIFIKFAPESVFANDDTYRDLLSNDLQIPTTKSRIFRKELTDTKITFYPNIGSSSSCYATSTTIPAANTSYVVTGVCNRITSPYAEIYINGVSEGTDTDNYTANVWGTNFRIGIGAVNGTELNGIIQKVVIFNRALSASEVLSVNNSL